MSKAARSEREKQQAAGALLAAEADFLHACGWQPLVVEGKVRWQNDDHGGSVTHPQHEAVERQKRWMRMID